MNDLAVFAFGRDLAHGVIPIWNQVEKVAVVMHPHARIRLRVFLGDFGSLVLALVVDDDVLEILVGLGQNAIDALAQVSLAVVDGRDHAHERRGISAQGPAPLQKRSFCPNPRRKMFSDQFARRSGRRLTRSSLASRGPYDTRAAPWLAHRLPRGARSVDSDAKVPSSTI